MVRVMKICLYPDSAIKIIFFVSISPLSTSNHLQDSLNFMINLQFEVIHVPLRRLRFQEHSIKLSL